MAEAVIVAAARTPIGKVARGSLADVRSDDLGGFAVDRALDRVPALDPASVSDLYWGCALTYHSQGYNIARQVGLLSRLPDSVPAVSIDRQCGSSQQAVHFAAQGVMSGTQDLVVAGENSFTSGGAAARQLLERTPRPSAIFAGNDDMAAGVLAVAHEADIDVPGQLSIVGFDDSDLAKAVWPPLTTMRQPVRELAYAAADLMLSPEVEPRVTLEHKLMIRSTTGPAPR